MAAARNETMIGVIGAGAMGRGIVQVAAQGGMRVLLHDAAPGAAEKGREQVCAMIDRTAEKGRIDPAEAASIKARIEIVDGIAGLAPAVLVVEAVVESLEVKRQVFRAVEEVVADSAIIASNTSSIPIATIAAACRVRERVAGLHFFNPVPLMPLVEVIRAPATSEQVVQALIGYGKRMGRVPVAVKDSPGFLVNLGGRAFTTEGLRIHSEGVAAPHEIDAIMRDAGGFRMGPFELMDLTGIDVNFPVSQIIYSGYFHDRRLATMPVHQAMMEAGRYGRKTRQGWYAYDENGNKQAPDPDAGTDAAPAPALRLIEPDGRLVELASRSGADILESDDGVSPLLAAPLGEDASSLAARMKLDPARLVAVDLTGNHAQRLTMMTPPGGDARIAEAALARLRLAGQPVTRIKDSPGFVLQRIRAMIANLGAEMAQIGLASPADIDTAMKLGLNYPQGPLEMAEAMGRRETLQIMQRLQDITGDDRYRPSLWLRRRALLDLPMHVPG
ncbi:MAG: 3-hydroxyacyl-CoA dehydrogenase [Alphaproteobacteria bacterium]|nr:3-hydroxyacyl-CoA dehydrogenase [Alphaproteobacteria bacterium]